MNRHSSAGKDEANPHPHHSSYEQMGQLVDRERVLIGENDQLRAQLVERKEQEKKKFADLMVQYRQLRDNANIKQEDENGAELVRCDSNDIHMKREYEDAGMDHEGTSNNQVTVKTEWNDEEVKVEIKDEYEENDDVSIKHEYVPAYIKTESIDDEVKVEIKEEYEENDDVSIKHEYVPAYIKTESIDDEVKEEIKEEYENDLDNEDPSTNAHNVTELNIKTESMECDLVEVKDEIKEEDEDRDEDCDGCERCVVKKELVSDDDGDETEDNQTGGDDESRSVNVQMEEEFDKVDIEGGEHNQVDAERYEAIQANLNCGQLVSNPSRDSLNASNEDSFNEGGAILGSEQLVNTLNEPTEGTVTQSGDVLSPWTSTGQDSSRTALNQQATGSTQHNKRKQAQLKRTGKRSKKTLQDGDGDDEENGEDIGNEDGDEAKGKVIYLNCTQSECNVKLDSLVDLHGHLRTMHQLAPLQCFAMDCNARFDNRIQIRDHIQLRHPQSTRFLCAVCPKEFDSQTKTYQHWYQNHLTGQFKCTFVSDCAQVTDTRRKMRTHQRTKHHSQSKLLHCTQPGCTASFAFKDRLERHKLTHLDSRPFQCTWLHCNIRTNERGNLVRHIRTRHFGLPDTMKEQMAKNIVDVRDPNEYVQVVADE